MSRSYGTLVGSCWPMLLIQTCCSICCTPSLHQITLWRERSRQDLWRPTEQWNLSFTLLWWFQLSC